MRTILVVFFILHASAHAEEIIVQPGEKIQHALDKAQPGDTILIRPGTYHEALHLDKSDIKIIGQIEGGAWPIIDGQHVLHDALITSGSNLEIKNLHMKRFRANGVTTQGGDNITMSHLIVEGTGIYGIYPTHGRNIKVEHNIVTGIADAGIYIGMCKNVDVRYNEAFDNVAGIEIENSEDVLVEGNTTYDNTGGILVFTLPGLPKKDGRRIVVRRNFVRNNNHYNYAEAGAIVASVPPGSGILVLASNEVEIYDNVISDNALAGVIIADLGVMQNTKPDPAVNPNPDAIRIGRNQFYRNGHKGFWDRAIWLHFLAKNLAGGASPEGADDIFPPGADVAGTNKGSGCITPGQGIVTVDIDHFTDCEDHVKSMQVSMLKAPGELASTEDENIGKKTFNIICAGCHAYGFRLIGPPIEEVQAKYEGNASGLAAFAKAPKKVRKDYPAMPPHAHLPDETLAEVAKYMLTIEK